MKKGDLYYCDKCGKGVMMSWTCPKCDRLLCDMCSEMSDPEAGKPKDMGGFTVQTLGGNEPSCPYCDKGEAAPQNVQPQAPGAQPRGKSARLQPSAQPVQKVQCSQCGAMILPATAARNSGTCMPCSKATSNTKSGCFIATACYGSDECPEVECLRIFRDISLLSRPLGRAFVRFYYLLSPPVARCLELRPALAMLIRKRILDRVVRLAGEVNARKPNKPTGGDVQ